jgi:glycerol kinase
MGYVAAVDQGTTSTRCLVIDDTGAVKGHAQLAHRQLVGRPGHVEHDPTELLSAVRHCVDAALTGAALRAEALSAIGLTNQRETAVAWDRRSGRPLSNAIVWQDTRHAEVLRRDAVRSAAPTIRAATGLPLATYFTAGRYAWMLEELEEVRAAARRGTLALGTVDSWLIWNLTGGPSGGRHLTDVTNASRTMLMDLLSLDWDAALAALFSIPIEALPHICASIDPDAYGLTVPGRGIDAAVPVTALLGDQQAALIGQGCTSPGQAKVTYGTGSFLLMHTGATPVRSDAGLLTTIALQRAGGGPTYALEGSVADAGAAVQWLADQLGILTTPDESEALAASVDDTEGLYFVPAFSGLFAPHWRPDATGVVIGLRRAHTAAHLTRAALEAICYQTRDVLDVMALEGPVAAGTLRVDGGVSANDLCMQLQADVLGRAVERPAVIETTALGVGLAAGLGVGLFGSLEELARTWRSERRFEPSWSAARRDAGYAGWRRALQQSIGWRPDKG